MKGVGSMLAEGEGRCRGLEVGVSVGLGVRLVTGAR